MQKFYLLTILLLSIFLLSGCSIFPKQIKIKKDNTQHILKNKEHALHVTATAYTSRHNETDSTPYLAAWNNKLRPSVKSIAVSRDLLKMGLTNGVKVRIGGLSGTYIVLDKMNKRWKKKIDIYMGLNRRRAIQWGKKNVTIFWKKKTITKDKQTPSPTLPNSQPPRHLFDYIAYLLQA